MARGKRTSRKNDRTKAELGAQALREAILRGDLVPGGKLKQQELAEQLGISPTPVREMLRLLEAENLLEHVPYQGWYVAEPTAVATEEISPIRAALESLAVRMAVPHLGKSDHTALEDLQGVMEKVWQDADFAHVRRSNYEFHMYIYRASRSETLCELIGRVWPRFYTDILWMIPGRGQNSIQQHRAILEAIREGDAIRAGDLMVEHIMSAGKSIVEFMKNQEGALFGREARGVPKLEL